MDSMISDMSKELPPSRTADQFVLRFPEGMRDRIAETAKRNGRSMNAEIIHRIELSLPPEMETPTGQHIIDTLREMKMKMTILTAQLEVKKPNEKD